MVENLLFSLERVAPFFLLIALGFLLSRLRGATESFFTETNSFVYQVALPVNLFCSIAAPGHTEFNLRFMGFMFAATVGSFFLIWLVTELVYSRDKTVVGTLVQGGFRGNAALVGVPLAEAVAGPSAARLAALCIIAVVPAYNVLSVAVLMLRGKEPGRPSIPAILRGIAKNRLILGIICALPFAAFDIAVPSPVFRTLNLVGQVATPLGLLSIGGLFKLADATARLRPALYASFIKLVALPLGTLLLSYAAGFRGEELIVLFLLFGTPTAVSSFAMATALGGDGPLASNILILTTVFSSFTFAAGIFAMRTLGFI